MSDQTKDAAHPRLPAAKDLKATQLMKDAKRALKEDGTPMLLGPNSTNVGGIAIHTGEYVPPSKYGVVDPATGKQVPFIFKSPPRGQPTAEEVIGKTFETFAANGADGVSDRAISDGLWPDGFAANGAAHPAFLLLLETTQEIAFVGTKWSDKYGHTPHYAPTALLPPPCACCYCKALRSIPKMR